VVDHSPGNGCFRGDREALVVRPLLIDEYVGSGLSLLRKTHRAGEPQGCLVISLDISFQPMKLQVVVTIAEGEPKDQFEAFFHVSLTLIRLEDAITDTSPLVRTANDSVDADEADYLV